MVIAPTSAICRIRHCAARRSRPNRYARKSPPRSRHCPDPSRRAGDAARQFRSAATSGDVRLGGLALRPRAVDAHPGTIGEIGTRGREHRRALGHITDDFHVAAAANADLSPARAALPSSTIWTTSPETASAGTTIADGFSRKMMLASTDMPIRSGVSCGSHR